MPPRWNGILITTATAVLVAAVTAAWYAPAAQAHGETSPLIRTVVERVEAPAPGVRVTTEAGAAAALRIANRGPAELEMTAPGGEPFLRIGRRGTFANVSSLYWYKSGNPDGVGALPRGVPRGAPPRWVQISRAPEWTWFEHRLHPAPVTLPRELVGAQRRQKLAEWSIPLRLDGRPGQIDGYVEYRPPVGSVVTALASPAQPLSSVSVAVVPGAASALYLQNEGRRAVTILGRAGEPFARIGPRGAEVNLNSPTHHDDQRANGATTPGTPDPAAPPRWRRVDETPSYLWIESRFRYGTGEPPDAIQERRTPTVLSRWEVPLESPTARATIRGRTSWVPYQRPPISVEPSGGPSSALLVPIGLAVAALGVFGALRLRRRRAQAGSHSLTAG